MTTTVSFPHIIDNIVSPVLPVQILKVNMWKKEVRILLETVVMETVKAIISGAYIGWKLVEAAAIGRSTGLKSEQVFDKTKKRFDAN